MTNLGGRSAERSLGWLPLLAALVIVDACLPALAGSGEAVPSPPMMESGVEPDARDDAAIAALKRELVLRPEDAELNYRLGLALRQARRRTESVPFFERAVTIGPATRARLLDLGVAYSDVSRFADAESAYRRLLAGTPADPDALGNLANVSLRRGEFAAAIDLYKQAVAAQPRYLHGWYHLGHTLKFVGRTDEARDAYAKVLELTPATEREQAARIDALYQIGSMDLARGRTKSAEAYFQQVVKASPSHRAAHWGLAQALLRQGRTEEARVAIETHARLLAERPPTGPSASVP